MTFTERALATCFECWSWHHPSNVGTPSSLQDAISYRQRALLVHQRWLRENGRKRELDAWFRHWCGQVEFLEGGKSGCLPHFGMQWAYENWMGPLGSWGLMLGGETVGSMSWSPTVVSGVPVSEPVGHLRLST